MRLEEWISRGHQPEELLATATSATTFGIDQQRRVCHRNKCARNSQKRRKLPLSSSAVTTSYGHGPSLTSGLSRELSSSLRWFMHPLICFSLKSQVSLLCCSLVFTLTSKATDLPQRLCALSISAVAFFYQLLENDVVPLLGPIPPCSLQSSSHYLQIATQRLQSRSRWYFLLHHFCSAVFLNRWHQAAGRSLFSFWHKRCFSLLMVCCLHVSTSNMEDHLLLPFPQCVFLTFPEQYQPTFDLLLMCLFFSVIAFDALFLRPLQQNR